MQPLLFSPLKIRGITFKNRIFVSPMCQYSAIDGVPNDWHLVHLGTRATGGAALVIVEATSPTPQGRISSSDLGLWNEAQEDAFKKITTFIKSQDCVPGIQLAHAGRKASTDAPWRGGKPLNKSQGGWDVIAPSAKPFHDYSPIPEEMSEESIQQHVELFVEATTRALRAGFEVLELHMAHGYLFHQFLSPLTNFRTDEFGGSLENRMRFPLMAAKRMREEWPMHLPLFVRISATDWVEGGWDLEQSIVLSKELKAMGVDFIDCSTGGNVPHVKIPTGPHYQVPFAKSIRSSADIMTGAVGLITTAKGAEEILQKGEADAVLLARELLRNPYFPMEAAKELGAKVTPPPQYERAFV